MAVCQNLVPLVNIKMFIPLKMVLIGIDSYPYYLIVIITSINWNIDWLRELFTTAARSLHRRISIPSFVFPKSWKRPWRRWAAAVKSVALRPIFTIHGKHQRNWTHIIQHDYELRIGFEQNLHLWGSLSWLSCSFLAILSWLVPEIIIIHTSLAANMNQHNI